jgi:hypothetical protein
MDKADTTQRAEEKRQEEEEWRQKEEEKRREEEDRRRKEEEKRREEEERRRKEEERRRKEYEKRREEEERRQEERKRRQEEEKRQREEEKRRREEEEEEERRREEVRGWKRNAKSQFELAFIRSLEAQDQTQASKGRAAVLVHSTKEPFSRRYEHPSRLSDDLKHRLFEKIQKKGRILIVLEDLSSSWVEFLGSQLGIPVSVFALHWSNPIDHVSGEVRVPIGESPGRHFILNYRQSLPIVIEDKENVIELDGEERGEFRKSTRKEILYLTN